MYTPKFIRKSIWSVVIGLDDLTVYCELNGRVYRVVGNDDDLIPAYRLPEMYPSLFVLYDDKFSTNTLCDFSQLPPFNQDWQHIETGYAQRSPDLSCTEK